MSQRPPEPLWHRVRRKARHIARGELHRASTSLRDLGLLSSQDDYVPFVILGTGRTGSTMLVSLLQSHPQCVCYSELYHSHHPMWFYPELEYLNSQETLDLWRSDVQAFFERLVYRSYPPGICAVGFKLLYCDTEPEAWFRERAEPWRVNIIPVLRERGLRAIHIRRRNHLARYVSQRIADRDRVWVASGEAGSVGAAPIELDVSDCLRVLGEAAQEEERYAERFTWAHVLDLYYEDLLVDRETAMAKVQRFLGLGEQPLEPAIRRQSRSPLPERIGNFDEVAEALRSTPYARFLEADPSPGGTPTPGHLAAEQLL